MAEYTTLEIAAMCERTERSVQRWLKEGRLPAQHIQGNRYEVDENDLAPFLPHVKAEDYVRRLDALESRVQVLEQQLAALSSNRPPRVQHTASRPSASSTLPDGWMSLLTFCDLHNIAETTARRYLNPERVKKGTWEHDHSLVKVAIDPAGQRHLWNIFSHKTRFKPCDRCPHDEPSMP